MLGNTLTVEFGNTTYPNPQTLVRINQDGYSSEYRLKGAGVTYTALIRHSTEKNKVGGLTIDRHQLLVRQFDDPTDVYPQGVLKEAYIIVRCPSSATPEEIGNLIGGVAQQATAHSAALANWES